MLKDCPAILQRKCTPRVIVTDFLGCKGYSQLNNVLTSFSKEISALSSLLFMPPGHLPSQPSISHSPKNLSHLCSSIPCHLGFSLCLPKCLTPRYHRGPPLYPLEPFLPWREAMYVSNVTNLFNVNRSSRGHLRHSWSGEQ